MKTAAACVAAAGLTACATSADQPATVTETAPAPVATDAATQPATDAATQAATQAPADPATEAPAAAQPGAAQGDLPAAVTGYTGEAREDMAEDNLTEADIEAVLAAAHRGEAEVEWEDDGYWELEWQNIDVDIDPSGMVLEADR